MSSAAVAAVDVGSGYVKAIANGLDINSPRVSFPSIIGEFPESKRDNFGSNEIPVIEYDGKTWITGQYALGLRQHHIAKTLAHDWAGSTPWTVLLLRALHDLGIYQGDVDLVTGIPQAQYRDNWRNIAKNLMGEHRAVVHGKPMHINIIRKKSMIMPQAAAGIYYWISQDKGMQDIVSSGGLIAGIDVGTYTTGLAVLDGGRPYSELSGGIDIGMSRVAATVGTRLHSRYNVALDFKTSMSMVENRHKVFLGGSLIDISEDVRIAVEEMVSGPLMNAIYSTWGNEVDRMKIGVYGGGAVDFYPFIKEVLGNAELVHIDSMGGGRYLPVMGMLTYYAGANGLLGL